MENLPKTLQGIESKQCCSSYDEKLKDFDGIIKQHSIFLQVIGRSECSSESNVSQINPAFNTPE